MTPDPPVRADAGRAALDDGLAARHPARPIAIGSATAACRSQWTLLTLSAAVLAVSFLLECTEDGHIGVPVAGAELPGVCWWRRTTGLDCPGCGLTRSFVSLAHGNVAAAMGYHPLGIVLFGLVVAQLPYRGIQLVRLARGGEEWSPPALGFGLWLLFAVLVLEWLLRIFGLSPL